MNPENMMIALMLWMIALSYGGLLTAMVVAHWTGLRRWSPGAFLLAAIMVVMSVTAIVTIA